MSKFPLGGMSAQNFLRQHWQKRPLLIRDAIPGFSGILDFSSMVDLACRADCESRLIVRQAGRWSVEHGPFVRRRFTRLPARNWTLLVQGLEQLLPAARNLLEKFSFIPHARLDDIMVSFAPPGGGVGPHYDSYDVFLLQGPGQRRWSVSRRHDFALVENAPLKLIKDFSPEGTCLVCAGDMLYLPPAFAHDGAAVDACFTYSIGFRAPSHQELASQFLIYLQDNISLQGRYSDPDLSVSPDPARISQTMLEQVERVLGKIDWKRSDVAEFLGIYLTEPKAHVLFARPAKALSESSFSRQARQLGVKLTPGSQMLFGKTMFFINGEKYETDKSARAPLRRLANSRTLSGRAISSGAMGLLYRWYRAGYIGLSR